MTAAVIILAVLAAGAVAEILVLVGKLMRLEESFASTTIALSVAHGETERWAAKFQQSERREVLLAEGLRDARKRLIDRGVPDDGFAPDVVLLGVIESWRDAEAARPDPPAAGAVPDGAAAEPTDSPVSKP